MILPRMILPVLLALSSVVAANAGLRPTQLRCDYRAEPLGIDTPQPRLSWILESTEPNARGLRQTAYQILVASNRQLLRPGEADLWDSGKVASDQMAHIAYGGRGLASRQRCFWAVRVWDQDGRASEWISPASWTMGLLEERHWQAKWIALPGSGDKSGPLPLFRREIVLNKRARFAVAYVCGLGFYELRINGQRVGDQVLDPGWTNYRKRCFYATHDVSRFFGYASATIGRTTMVTNVIGVMLGNGMYNVRGGRYVKFTGSFGPPKLIFQLHLEFDDGTSTNLVSDGTWKTAPGPITFSCIYGGEDYDARLEQPGWDKAGFEDSRWRAAVEVRGPGGKLVSQSAPPIKVMRVLEKQKITEPKPGVFVYDLGQNFSGWPQLTVKGPPGGTVRMIPGELLGTNGLVSQRSSGGPVHFSYTLKGNGAEVWHPRFSYYGFRYVQVEGAVPSGPAQSAADRAVVLGLEGHFTHSSARSVSVLGASHGLIGDIHRLILAAIDSNLQSVLTDCPHREKLGWLEVSHLLGPAIMFNHDVHLLWRKICDDMAEAQLDNGLVPDIAPEFTVFSGGFRDSPEWGSACAVNPWLLYQRYGDLQPLAQHYDVIERYVAYLGSRATNHIVAHGLGDWYDIGPKPPGESQLTTKGLTATAIYYHDIDILRQAAALLGKQDDAEKYAALAAEVRRAFNAKFFNPATSQYDRGSQTANAMPLVLGLVEPAHEAAVLDNLVKDIRARGNQVTAGDVGFRYVVEALRIGGRSDVVLDMVTRRDGPGYAMQLAKGATALTEAWDADPASSHNHCMLGHAEEWFFTGLAGINPDPAGPGFRKIIIKPQVLRDCPGAIGHYESISGRIESVWRATPEGRLEINVVIPPNTTATMYVPVRGAASVQETGQPAERAAGVRFLRRDASAAVYEVGSGRYSFSTPWPHQRTP